MAAPSAEHRHRDPRAAQGVLRARRHAGRGRGPRPHGAARARCTGSSGPTAPARPRRSGCCSAWPGHPRRDGAVRAPGAPTRCPRSWAGSARSWSRPSSPPTSPAGRTCGCSPGRSASPTPGSTRRSRPSGLTGRDRERYKTYSLGMKQRLAIAATLLKDPALLILDEPTNGLDPAGIREVREVIRGLGDAGVTVLLSSHILAEVQQVCTAATILGNGRTLASRAASPSCSAASTAHRVVAPDLAAARAALEAAGLRVTGEDGPAPARRDRPARRGHPGAGRGRASGSPSSRPVRADLESIFLEVTEGEQLGGSIAWPSRSADGTRREDPGQGRADPAAAGAGRCWSCCCWRSCCRSPCSSSGVLDTRTQTLERPRGRERAPTSLDEVDSCVRAAQAVRRGAAPTTSQAACEELIAGLVRQQPARPGRRARGGRRHRRDPAGHAWCCCWPAPRSPATTGTPAR